MSAQVDVARTRDGVLVVLHVRELQELVSAWLLSQQHPHARSEHGESTPPSPRMLPGDTHTPWGVQLSQLQVGDLSWGELQRLRWPGTDQGVLRVAEAITLTSPYVDCVTLDIKTYVDRQVGRWGFALQELFAVHALLQWGVADALLTGDSARREPMLFHPHAHVTCLSSNLSCATCSTGQSNGCSCCVLIPEPCTVQLRD